MAWNELELALINLTWVIETILIPNYASANFGWEGYMYVGTRLPIGARTKGHFMELGHLSNRSRLSPGTLATPRIG
jgi:hypothetical protein